MAEDQFREKTWAEEQEDARRIMAEQEAAIAETKAQEGRDRMPQEEPADLSAEAMDRERGARFGQVIAMERARATVPETEGGSTSPDIMKIDAEIKKASLEAESRWKSPYLMLTVGAGVCDLLQLVGDATLFLSIVSSAVGVVFSGARYLVLRSDTQRTGNKAFEKEMVTRTLVSGAISMIPIVDFLPEQTATMLIEWQKRHAAAEEASTKLNKLKRQRAELVKQLSQEEDEAMAA